MIYYIIDYKNKKGEFKFVEYKKCNTNNPSTLGEIIHFQGYQEAFEFTHNLKGCSDIRIVPIKQKEVA